MTQRLTENPTVDGSGQHRTGAEMARAGASAAVLAAAATTAVATVARQLGVDLAVDGDGIPLGAFAVWSILATTAGVGLALVARTRDRFVWIATLLTAVSLIPAIGAPEDLADGLVLALTHVIAALIVVPRLGRLLPRR